MVHDALTSKSFLVLLHCGKRRGGFLKYLENQNPKNSSGQRKNLRYFGKNKKTSVFD